jgi:hypothetical protein
VRAYLLARLYSWRPGWSDGCWLAQLAADLQAFFRPLT